MKQLKTEYKILGLFLALTLLSGVILSSSSASANSGATVNVSIKVPSSCTLSITTGQDVSATINSGQNGLIGTTGLKALCNDGNGLAIYAIGITGDVHGDTNLRRQETNDTLSNTILIPTGAASSPSASQWNMTVTNNTSVQNNYTATIPSAFQSPHEIPTNQTMIASYPSSTDQTTGTNINIDYNAYISPSQAAGIYKGKVKYTLVHPTVHDAPASRPATLDAGQVVNSKMKSLAKTVATGTTSTVAYNTSDSYIKAISVHTSISSLPSGLTPSETNTISSSASEHPVYIVFDNTNDAGIMHFYTTGDKIVLNADSSYLFSAMYLISGLSDLTDWDTSNVTSMYAMFSTAGSSATIFSLNLSGWDTSNVTDMTGLFGGSGSGATTWSVSGLSNWDTSNVTSMASMFGGAGAGNNITTFSVSDLSNWDTSSVTTMGGMFSAAGRVATQWSVGDLSGWDTSSVTNMSGMFSYAGYNATTWSIGDLSEWDTSSVTNMSSMFSYAGYNATTWSIGDLSDWDTSSVTNMSYMFETAGYSATTFSLDLSGWDTPKATNMSYMFSYAGYNATTWSIGDLSEWDTSSVTNMDWMFSSAGHNATTWSIGNLSGWDTSSVTNMQYMFHSAGYNATTFSLDISGWDTSNVTYIGGMLTSAGYNTTTWTVIIAPTNGGGINNSTTHLYGSTSSTYASPDSGKSFTLNN